jgi:methyltransferase, FkbM family
MKDVFAVEAASYITTFTCPVFVSRSWPQSIANLPLISKIPTDLLANGEFVFVLHKDDLCINDFAIYAAALGRATPAYANEVYVLFDIRASEHDHDDIKSLYIKAADMSNKQISNESTKTNFCTYIGDRTVLTETVFGSLIYVDSSDISVSPHIMRNGLWEQHVTRFITENLHNGDSFIDIGANCGYFTILAAHIVGPDGFVLGIEPQHRLSQLVRKSLSINGFERFSKIENCAVSAEHGEMRLSYIGDYLGSASLISHGDKETTCEIVKSEPLEDLVLRIESEIGSKIRPRFIKIDAEGFEESIWLGARSILDSSPLNIIMEFSPLKYREIGVDPAAFLDRIIADGFIIHELRADGKAIRISPEQREYILNKSDFTDLVLIK